MKHSNLVVGEKVQAKRTHTDPSRPALTLAGGAVFTVEYVFCDPDTGFRLSGETLGAKFGYGVAENFRKYKEPEQEPQQEVAHQYKVGDKVVVGAEGAGYREVLPEYADKVCTITEVDVFGQSKLVKITHPDVIGGYSYTSKVKYLTPHVAESDVPFKEGTIVKLKEDTVSKHSETVPFGLYVARGTVVNEGWTILYTKHGSFGRAVVRTELLTAVGALTKSNEEQDDGQA